MLKDSTAALLAFNPVSKRASCLTYAGVQLGAGHRPKEEYAIMANEISGRKHSDISTP